MAKYFSPSNLGFYDSEIHGKKMPKDAIEITDEQHQALLAAQSLGHKIIADDTGAPTTFDYAATDEIKTAVRIGELRRNLANSDFKVLPDYQSRAGKTDAEMAQIIEARAGWYQELQTLLNKETNHA